MDKGIRTIGPRDGLRFEFQFDDAHFSSRHQAWGGGRLFFADDIIWADEKDDDDTMLYWSWFDLLEYLTSYWPWLVLEQCYPIPVNPLDPVMLHDEAERRWQGFPQTVVEEEDMMVYAFLMRHNLALALKGVFVPCIMIMRRGNECLISVDSPKNNYIRPMHQVIETLEAVGDFLVGIVGEENAGYAGEIVNKWNQRDRYIAELRLDILSGMDREAREHLEDGVDPEHFWGLSSSDTDSEIAAAARMTSAVFSPTIQKTLIEEIRSVRHYETGILDALAAKAALVIDPDMRPYEQGYFLAEWLRNELKIGEEALVEPEKILGKWNVEILEITFPDLALNLDAVAAWGPRHGPVVIMNSSEGARCSHAYGRRATLAHEICHLLLDRENGLPMAEVLGGLTPESLEQRARAFAAEFLLPRGQAIAAMLGSGSVEAILDKLTKQFQVSREVAAWQVVNSRDFVRLYKPDQAELKRIISSF